MESMRRTCPEHTCTAREAIINMTTRFLAALAAACIACVGLAACGKAATPAAAPARTTSPATFPAAATTPTPAASPSPSVASIKRAICAAAVPQVSGGDHCAVSYLKISTVDADWVHATVGLYNSQDQPESDGASVIFNLSTRELVGPADDGFCVEGTGTPIPGYSSVPANVLTGFGLTPCSSAVATKSPTTKTTPPLTLASLAGTWGAHEERLVIGSTGTGQLSYADLTLCPSCSMATAPVGTLAFTLTSVSNDEATGRVTASSDPKNYTVGEAVQATLTAGSPGQLLNLDIGGHQLTAFCDSTSAGQCGA
jgi:hypothetical protein